MNTSLQGWNERRTTHAFTLIELMVVMAIIVLLASLLLRSAAHIAGETQKRRCLAQMERIAAAFDQYYQDTGEYWPLQFTNPAQRKPELYLVPKYLATNDLIDPWGIPFTIEWTAASVTGGGPDAHAWDGHGGGVHGRFYISSNGPVREGGSGYYEGLRYPDD